MQIQTLDEGRRHKRVLHVDDKEVAHLWVIDYRMRVGPAEVRMAGIGDVYTNREYRMKGYMRHLYSDTLTYMTEEGYDVSMLFGIPNFYTKFGYISSLPIERFTIKTRDAETAEAQAQPTRSRPIEPGDMPAVLDLYNAKNATRTGTLIRDPDTFTEFRQGTHWSAQAEAALWEDEAGALLGYAVWDKRPTEVKVAELEAWSSDFYPTLLTAFARQAIEKRCESITFEVPPDHAFAEYAQRFGVSWTIEYPRYSDGMMRILNQQPLFEKLAPVFAQRLSAASGDILPDALTITTDLGTTTLSFDGGKVTVTEGGGAAARLALSQDKLMQLIMGYRSVADVLTVTDATVEGNAMPVLALLFPKDNPYVWRPDYF